MMNAKVAQSVRAHIGMYAKLIQTQVGRTIVSQRVIAAIILSKKMNLLNWWQHEAQSY